MSITSKKHPSPPPRQPVRPGKNQLIAKIFFKPDSPRSEFTLQRLLNLWLPTLIWPLIIWWLSAQPSLPGPPTLWGDFVFKKSAHMFMYALLYFWYWRALYFSLPKKAPVPLLAFLIVLLLAIIDEGHQSFVPGRTATGRDVVFDLLGATTMFLWLCGYI
jgi:hypothetical protein